MSRLWLIISMLGVWALTWGMAPAGASAGDAFSSSQRAEIIRILRDALKSDPTILSDAITSLKAKAQAVQQSDEASLLRSAKDRLETAPDYAVRGNPHGDVTIVEFFDPRCGYCKRVLPVIDDVLKRDKNIRFIEKIVPVLSDKSVTETRAIIAAARQGGYERMKRALMSENATPTDAHLREVATRVGLDAGQLLKDMSRKEVLAQVRTNLDQAREIDLSGTPTFIFNHELAFPGYMSSAEVLEKIAAVRKKN